MADHSVHIKEVEKLNKVAKDYWTMWKMGTERMLPYILFPFLIGCWSIPKIVRKYTKRSRPFTLGTTPCSQQKSRIWTCPLKGP